MTQCQFFRFFKIHIVILQFCMLIQAKLKKLFQQRNSLLYISWQKKLKQTQMFVSFWLGLWKTKAEFNIKGEMLEKYESSKL